MPLYILAGNSTNFSLALFLMFVAQARLRLICTSLNERQSVTKHNTWNSYWKSVFFLCFALPSTSSKNFCITLVYTIRCSHAKLYCLYFTERIHSSIHTVLHIFDLFVFVEHCVLCVHIWTKENKREREREAKAIWSITSH